MKKILSFILCIALIVAVLPLQTLNVFAASTWPLTFGLNSDGASYSVSDCNTSASGSLSIPSTYNGKPVTSIGDYAFENCTSLKSVTIGSSVTSIGDRAFAYCYSLTSVTIGDSVTSIGEGAFYYCDSLTSVTIPDSVTSIGDEAFYGCDSLTSVTISDSVTSIGDYAFYYSLKTVYYRGSQTDRKNITIGSDNSNLTGATWYYNSCIGSTKHSYTLNGNNSCNICKYSKAPDAPKTTEITLTSVTLEKVDGLEYSIDGVNWQDSNVFLNLKPITNYTFYQRVKASEFSKVSEKSIGLNVTTLKYTNTIIPSAPLLETKTDKTVTLVKMEGCEYSKNGTTWQDSNVFNNLSPNTEYTFYQRIAETNDTYASEKSEGLTVTTLKTTNTVIPNIPTLVLRTDTSVTLKALSGYEYSIDGINWQKENFFENLTPATNYTFYQRIAETNTVYASETSKGLNVLTYSYPQTTSAPLLEAKTDKTVTLVKMEGYEYSKDGTTWQSSNVFNNLSPNTEYTFYQRIAETNDTYASEKSEGLTVKTYIENTNIPNKPTVLIFDDSSVTLKKVSGMEYSIDGENWQESNVFNGLLPNTEYSFYQRYAQNGDIYHSATSTALIVTTDRILQTEIPSAPTVESVTADKIILNKVDGCEYSKDGIKWQSSNVFNNLSCATEYTFYQRYAQNDTHYAGEKSAALKATTDKGIPNVPKAPTIESKNHNRVTLRLIDGYEYSMDGETWQKSNVFTGLNPFTNYVFFCRTAENDKYYASECSDGFIVKTDKQPAFIVGDCNGDYNVDTTDLASLKLFLAAISDLSDTGKLGADLNEDGKVDTTDLATLKLKLAGVE